ncbi:MAG: LamG domain-containing protein [gamma proteobacterium endosymbiont of Lamellibrachia anaximandri]|nr:LamG domain-containing protein [gamma proteobacterium endosymbiont of Lamellibrachia anaximandri]MBL3619524.1 LamG domain-containing protein [gamma proteobacterium endosymbiont of Lamellibrachia anaximandri]
MMGQNMQDDQSNAFLLGWGSNDPVFAVNVEGVQIQAKAEKVINQQGWYHLVGRYDGSQVTLTVNGENYYGDIQPGTLEHRSGPMYIGQGGSSAPINNLANGQLDEIRVYNRALSDMEVGELYAIGG